MSKTITLRYAAPCRDCGAELQPGDRARYYGRGRVYGVECHGKAPRLTASEKARLEVHAGTVAFQQTMGQRPAKPAGYSHGYWAEHAPVANDDLLPEWAFEEDAR